MNEKAMDIIDSEIEYAEMWDAVPRENRPLKDSEKPVEFWLTFIRRYLRKAEDACYGYDKTDAMDSVRIIAALCVRCIMHSEYARKREKE